MFLVRRQVGRGAANLEDDHHSTNKDCKFVLTNKVEIKGKLHVCYQTFGARLALFVPDQDSG